MLHFVLAKAALSGMLKQILQHRRSIGCWLSHIPLDKVKTYYSCGSSLSRDMVVPKVCLWFFLPNISGKKRKFEPRNQKRKKVLTSEC